MRSWPITPSLIVTTCMLLIIMIASCSGTDLCCFTYLGQISNCSALNVLMQTADCLQETHAAEQIVMRPAAHSASTAEMGCVLNVHTCVTEPSRLASVNGLFPSCNIRAWCCVQQRPCVQCYHISQTCTTFLPLGLIYAFSGESRLVFLHK